MKGHKWYKKCKNRKCKICLGKGEVDKKGPFDMRKVAKGLITLPNQHVEFIYEDEEGDYDD